jgi:PAS domain S-box-containing protein
MNEMLNVSPAASHHAPQEFIDDLPLPYMEIDRHGKVVRANRATQALHVAEHGSLIGSMAFEMMPSDEVFSSFGAFCAQLESGEAPGVVRRNIFVATGQFRTFELHRSLILNGEGKPDGMRMVGIDVTESVKALEETRTAALWLHSVLASLPEPVLIADAMGIVLSVNPTAEVFFGWLPNAVNGRLLEQVLPLALHAPAPNPPIEFHRTLEAPTRSRITVLDGLSNPVAMELVSSPISDAQTGHLAGVVCVLHRL